MKFLIALLIISTSTSSLALTDENKCKEMLSVEADFAKKLPLNVDAVTTVVEMSVNCETRIVKYVKHLKLEETDLAKGFRGRKQRQHTNLHCNNQGLASNGWTAMDNIFDKNMNLLVSLITPPSACENQVDS